jgi:dihydrofolate reductase
MIFVACDGRDDGRCTTSTTRGGEMGKVVVINGITLDGVMQSPGRPDEDTRGGFTHGGWAQRYADDEGLAAVYRRVAEGGGLTLLLGRRSYDGMLGYWNAQGGPFKEGLNDAPKYVASRTLREPLPWPNSTLLGGDTAAAVAQLKRDVNGDLTVMGSGDLLQTLMRHDLVDEYMLSVTPIVLGTGRRLFADGTPPTSLRLVDSITTSTGVVVACYETIRESSP